jgi:3-hydroxyisobutyrate dehydrogenase-like beta-hydroxyacid dehydrogenase
VAGAVDLVISMVADAPDVEQVMLGEQGVASAGRAGLVAVDMSTIRPAAARDIGARLRARGRFPRRAGFRRRGRGHCRQPVDHGRRQRRRFRNGAAGFRVHGQEHRACRRCGRRASGQGGQPDRYRRGVLTVAEALNFAARSGVDPAKVREALLGGFAYSKILENHGQRMLDRNFKPGFKSWMHQKDMNIVMQSAHELGMCLPVAAATAQMYNAMVGSGLGEEDSIAILKLLERLSGGED